MQLYNFNILTRLFLLRPDQFNYLVLRLRFYDKNGYICLRIHVSFTRKRVKTVQKRIVYENAYQIEDLPKRSCVDSM